MSFPAAEARSQMFIRNITDRARSYRTLLAVGLAVTLAGAARAQTTPQFFFTLAGQVPASPSSALTSLSVNPNQEFTLSVWYQFQPSPSVNYFGVNVFVGFDQTNAAGIAATPLNSRLTLGSGLNADTAVTNINNGSNPTDGHNPEGYTKLGGNRLGGGQDPNGVAGPTRPYGLDIALLAGNSLGDFYSGTGPSPVRLFDVTLRNIDLGFGGSETVTIYGTGNGAGGANDGFNTFLDTGAGATGRILGQSTSLQVLQPIPVSPLHVALPTGLFLMGLTQRRRRRRQRRTASSRGRSA